MSNLEGELTESKTEEIKLNCIIKPIRGIYEIKLYVNELDYVREAGVRWKNDNEINHLSCYDETKVRRNQRYLGWSDEYHIELI